MNGGGGGSGNDSAIIAHGSRSVPSSDRIKRPQKTPCRCDRRTAYVHLSKSQYTALPCIQLYRSRCASKHEYTVRSRNSRTRHWKQEGLAYLSRFFVTLQQNSGSPIRTPCRLFYLESVRPEKEGDRRREQNLQANCTGPGCNCPENKPTHILILITSRTVDSPRSIISRRNPRGLGWFQNRLALSSNTRSVSKYPILAISVHQSILGFVSWCANLTEDWPSPDFVNASRLLYTQTCTP